ncbi:chloride channel protein [Corynebacterium amycolatum]|uniref:chloride channel protein n=1 Tax=Corynebacterium amycolatum TaxID=43765 RepID=UPI003756964F
MHGIEYAVYGQHEGDVAVVTDGTTGLQRFVGIVLAGLIAGPIWAALRTKAKPVESVEAGMHGRPMPVWSTLVNVFLQMATVAAGASMGRENAPRELGAMGVVPTKRARKATRSGVMIKILSNRAL